MLHIFLNLKKNNKTYQRCKAGALEPLAWPPSPSTGMAGWGRSQCSLFLVPFPPSAHLARVSHHKRSWAQQPTPESQHLGC